MTIDFDHVTYNQEVCLEKKCQALGCLLAIFARVHNIMYPWFLACSCFGSCSTSGSVGNEYSRSLESRASTELGNQGCQDP